MSNLICKNCKSVAVEYEDYCGGQSYYRCETCGQHGDQNNFAQQTVFHSITQSEETLAEKLVYYENGTGYYHSTILFYKEYPNCPIDFNTESEAIAATVARLKEVCK